MATAKKQSPRFWDSAGNKIGVISGALGIILSAISIGAVFKKDNKAELEQEKSMLELTEKYEPQLVASYIDLRGDIYGLQGERDSIPVKNNAYFLDYPVVENGISINDSTGTSPADDENEGLHTIYLVIENRGKTAATNIELQINRCVLRQPVSVRENLIGEGDDYETKIESAAIEQKLITVAIPQVLETGKGVLVPLIISQPPPRYSGAIRTWKILSHVVYLPKVIKSKSAISNKQTETTVRKMRHPTRTSEGVEIRG